MGSICVKDATKVIDKSSLKLPFSYGFNIHRRYHFQRVLNQGAFGKVKLYSDRIFSGREYAIKCISKQKIKISHIIQIKNEIEILSSLDHPNIVSYFCTVENNKNYYILMEYLSGKDLDKIFKEDYNKLVLDDFRLILYQIFSALCYLHQNNIVHRDIKPANIICAKNNGKYDLKLIDFGLSVNLEKRGKNQVAGSLAYLSPEGLKGIIHVKNDMWACGIMLYWFIYGKMPFQKKSKNELYQAILNEEIEYDNSQMRAHIPKEAIDLCQQLLKRDFDERISAYDALRHPFFKKFDIEKDDNKIYENFFCEEKIYYIKEYNFGNILKKTFLYMYSKLSSYDEEEKVRHIFLTLQKNLNNDGTLDPRELFNEFKKRDLVTKNDMKTFSFVDPIKTRRVKKLVALHTDNSGKFNNKLSKKQIIALDWGIITYTIFICFHFVEEFKLNKKDYYKARTKYIFQLMSNGEDITTKIDEDLEKLEGQLKEQNKLPEEIKEILKEREKKLILANEWYINRRTFKRFIFKYALPFQYEKEVVEKFFLEHPNNIKLKEFEELIK